MMLGIFILCFLSLAANIMLLEAGKNRFLKPAMNCILKSTDYSKNVLEAEK